MPLRRHYTNNRGQQRTYSYDNAERLSYVLYLADSTKVQFSYDAAGHVLSRTERNNDVTRFYYDALYRVTGVKRVASSSTNPSWSQTETYDAVGNRTSLNADAGARYDVSKFDQDVYAATASFWTIPSPGYDALDRMPAYQDRLGNQTNISYDVDSNRTSMAYPNGSPAPVTSGSYDIRDRLMGLATSAGATGILSLTYGYDAATNRVAMRAGNDTLDYGVDDAGRLVHAALNRFVERLSVEFQAGTLSGAAVDPTSGGIVLLGYNDGLTGNISADRWRTAYSAWSVSIAQGKLTLIDKRW